MVSSGKDTGGLQDGDGTGARRESPLRLGAGTGGNGPFSPARRPLANRRPLKSSHPRMATMNNVIAQLKSHRSIRKFTGEPLDDATVAEIVACGQAAPTS